VATDIVLRSVKAASLTHAEMDQNWESLAQTVDAVTANKTVAVTDQNKILEVSISTGTITLPTVANAAGTDTDSFRITIKNINATSLTVDGNGAETIEGAANVALLENEVAEFTLSSGAAEWNITGFYNPNLPGITATATELNIMDGITPTTIELNYVNGVTSAIQTQIDTKAAKGANSDITSLTGLTTDLSIAQGGTAASTASGARTSLGVDAAGTDNSTDVTLAGTPNYLTIVGQAITRALITLTTHVTGILPLANGGTASSTAAGARTNLGLGSLAVLNSVAAAQIDTGAVGQSEIAANAVGQSEIKTSTQSDSLGATTFARRTMTGGKFTLYTQVKLTTTGYSSSADVGGLDISTVSTSFVTTRIYGMVGLNAVATFEWEYITASKPYDLGDGEIPLFIFLEIDNSTNEIVGTSIAEDPPWAYNGVTNTRPDYYKKQNGVLVPYQKVFDTDMTLDDCISDPARLEKYLDFMKSPKYKEIEVTQDIKNKDMALIPHNLANCDPEYIKGKSVVLVDPVSDICETLLSMHLAGESVGKLFLNGSLKIGNGKLNRCGSESNHIVSLKWATSA